MALLRFACYGVVFLVVARIGIDFLEKSQWTLDQIKPGSLDGKVAIVTGSNIGIGKSAALGLASKGCHVIMACRSQKRGEAAASEIRKATGNENVEVMVLDLGNLASVRSFAEAFKATKLPLHLLLNNAGVMLVGKEDRFETSDGFELHFGVNHLGHFLLTNLLLDTLKATAATSPPNTVRIVSESSMASWAGHFALNMSDIQSEGSYDTMRAYGISKLANLLFTAQLQKVAGDDIVCHTVHPGYTKTNLLQHVPKESWSERVTDLGGSLVAQSVTRGALSLLYASLAEETGAARNAFYGPTLLNFGNAMTCPKPSSASDAQLAQQLWEMSAQLTGLTSSAN